MGKQRRTQPIPFQFSNHADERGQMRGIKDEAINVMLKYGKRRRSGDGISVSMDKASRRRAEKGMGRKKYAKVESNLGFYLVLSLDMGTLITVAHRLQRSRRR